MLNNKASIANKYYQDSSMFDKGNYDVPKLLALGFVMSHHHSTMEAKHALWGQMNPELEDKVPKKFLIEALELICYWTIDVPIKVEESKEEPNEKFIEFLKEYKDEKEHVIADAVRDFDNEVTIEDIESLDDKWTASYKIRSLVCPNKTIL